MTGNADRIMCVVLFGPFLGRLRHAITGVLHGRMIPPSWWGGAGALRHRFQAVSRLYFRRLLRRAPQ